MAHIGHIAAPDLDPVMAGPAFHHDMRGVIGEQRRIRHDAKNCTQRKDSTK
jgi:hypothetical protein